VVATNTKDQRDRISKGESRILQLVVDLVVAEVVVVVALVVVIVAVVSVVVEVLVVVVAKIHKLSD
jgi:hypothetical protein